MQKFRLILSHVIVPLLLGGVIYIAFRSQSLILFTWFDKISISGFTNLIRDFLYPLNSILPEWVIYSLPDGLWVYSFTAFLIIIWNNRYESVKYWMMIPFTALLLIELLQLTGLLTGTCDLADIYVSLSAFVLCVYNMKLIPLNYEKQII